MREIKFRAWRKKYCWMEEVYLFDFSVNEVWLKHDGIEYYLNLNEVELMQYTGLKDKNEIEIYEGDILRVRKNISEKDFPEYTGEVKIHSIGYLTCGQYRILSDELLDVGCEVIGNIYENAELLGDIKK